uniref:Chitinase, acidic.1 n=1 Tax=Takifugu rubripes TaxID=31033 RepID=A0A3B5JZE1_TAKRU
AFLLSNSELVYQILNLQHRISATGKLVCYFTNWSQYRTGAGKFLPETIDPFLCTHLVYAFAIINYDHEVIQQDQPGEKRLYVSFLYLKDRNPHLKMLLSIRDDDRHQLSTMMSTPGSRQIFIQSAVRFLRTHSFDGLDLNWQYSESSPVDENRRFTLLCKVKQTELSEAFKDESSGGGSAQLLLSVAVATQTGIHLRYEPFEIHTEKLFPLSYQDYVIRSWIKGGTPAGKLLLGFPVHARSFTLLAPGLTTSGICFLLQTCSFLEGTSVHWIKAQKVVYAVKGNQWVGFDNQRSYDAKVTFLKSRQLGGAAVWTLDMDDFSGQFCGQGKYPLISHLKDKLSQGETASSDSRMDKTMQILHPSALVSTLVRGKSRLSLFWTMIKSIRYQYLEQEFIQDIEKKSIWFQT